MNPSLPVVSGDAKLLIDCKIDILIYKRDFIKEIGIKAGDIADIKCDSKYVCTALILGIHSDKIMWCRIGYKGFNEILKDFIAINGPFDIINDQVSVIKVEVI